MPDRRYRVGSSFSPAGLYPALLAVAGVALVTTASRTRGPDGNTRPSSSNGGACAADSATHLLDFWLGDWSVTDSAGTPVGSNRIESIVEGCAVQEIWHDPDGSEVRGLFYYQPAERIWKYILITPNALAPGGLKERRLVAHLADGTVRFQGEIMTPRGAVLDRMTLVPEPGNTIRETVEHSSDGGTTWQASFDGYYHRTSR